MTKSVTDKNFKEDVLDFEGLVVVDFWAEWCGPCKILGPIIDSVAEKHSSNKRLKLVKLDVDNNPKTQSEYRVMSIPTLMFFKNGELIETVVGLRSENDIEAMINNLS